MHLSQHLNNLFTESFMHNDLPYIVLQDRLDQRIIFMINIFNKVLTGAHLRKSKRIAIAMILDRSQVHRCFFIGDLIHDSAWCNDTDDIPFYQTDCFFGILHLFNNSDLIASGYKPLQIALHCMMRHAAHRRFVFNASTLSRQDQIQFF